MSHQALPKVTIGLLLFHGEKYLDKSIPSLVAQDYPNIEFLFRDHSPQGEAYEFIAQRFPEIMKKVHFEKGENLMHSGGNNYLMRKMTGEYYFCCSYDMLYPPDFVSKIVAEMEKPENQKYGTATCKLMNWKPEESSTYEEAAKSPIIDSFGISLTKGHHFFDLGQGQEDQGQYDHLIEVFGPNGALSVFRKKALEDIAYINSKGLPEYYDELIHYKNDVDLSYRFQWADQHCLFIKNVHVYHDRQVGATFTSKLKTANILKSRGSKTRWAKENSFFGDIIVMKKNYAKQPFSFEVKLRTALRKLLRTLYMALFERFLFEQYKLVKKHEAEIQDKTVKMPRKVTPKQIEHFMIS